MILNELLNEQINEQDLPRLIFLIMVYHCVADKNNNFKAGDG